MQYHFSCMKKMWLVSKESYIVDFSPVLYMVEDKLLVLLINIKKILVFNLFRHYYWLILTLSIWKICYMMESKKSDFKKQIFSGFTLLTKHSSDAERCHKHCDWAVHRIIERLGLEGTYKRLLLLTNQDSLNASQPYSHHWQETVTIWLPKTKCGTVQDWNFCA